jgi:hypothetical protein
MRSATRKFAILMSLADAQIEAYVAELARELANDSRNRPPSVPASSQ